MNYILIDYEKVSLSYLQSVIETDSQFYIVINRQKTAAIPLEFVELFLNHGKTPHFINIHAELPKSLSLQWAFLIGQIIGKDIHANIHILADQGELSFLSLLGEKDQIQWVSKDSNSLQEESLASLVVEKPSAIEAVEEEASLESEKNEEVLSESEPENEATPDVINQDTSQPVENKKERLKKQAILANEAEFVRFTTNYIFNLFATHLYTQKIIPPDLVIDLKNLLITEYFPPEENFALSDQTDNIIENVFARLTKKAFIQLEEEKVIYHLTPQFVYDSFVELLNQQQPKKYNGIVHIAKTELFFLKDDDQNINALIERAKDEGHFRLQNKRVIYSAKKENDATKEKQQNLQLKEIKVKKNLSAHHPKISLLMPRSEKIKKDADNHFQQALQLIKTPNRPKSIKHLKRFLSAKIPTDHHGIDLLVKRLFKERYIIVLNDDKISYRTELIKSSNYEKIIQFLKNGSQFKPKEELTLLNSIRSYLGDKISQAECQAIVKQLIDDGYIRIENGIAQYQL